MLNEVKSAFDGKRIFLTSLLLITFLIAGQIHPELQKVLNQMAPNDTIRVCIYLKPLPIPNFSPSISQKAKIDYFKNAAAKNQETLKKYLTTQTDIWGIRCFWVGNLIVATTTKEMIAIIVQRPEVERIEENYLIYLEPFEIQDELIENPPSLPIWSIRRVGAPECWAAGYNGQGIVIGFIDTGVDANHPALKDNWTGQWFDLVNDSTHAYDDIGHGTHTSGTACGKLNIGVAPGAKFMMAKVFGGPNNEATVEAIHQAFEWYAEMENPPQILSNSWGAYNPNLLTFWQDILTVRALGIIPVFSNGNGGNWTLGSPASYPTVIAVGATSRDDSIASFSSRGPAPSDTAPWNDPIYWPRPDWHYIKPNISAPGNWILSSLPGGVYGLLRGTSMSCPNVSGCIAILLQKYPHLNFEEIYSYIVDNASQVLNFSFPNNDYGWGIIDAYAMLFQNQSEPLYADIKIYPNPSFKGINIIGSFRGYQFVTAKIYDLSGRLISDLTSNTQVYNGHTYLDLSWDGNDYADRKVVQGIYFVYLIFRQPDNKIKTFSQKFILLRQGRKNK